MVIVRGAAVVVGVLLLGVAATENTPAVQGAGLLIAGGVTLVMAGLFAGRERADEHDG